MKFTVEIPVLEKTFAFFMAIFVLILLYNLLQIRIVSPVELLHGSNQGEREPKTKWLLAIVGAILLGTGYYIAQTTGNPLDAMTKFFFAVVCVVLGTYGLFIAGSIAVLKMLKEKQKILLPGKTFYGSIRHGLPHETKRSGARKHLHLKYDGTDYGVHYRLPLCGYE